MRKIRTLGTLSRSSLVLVAFGVVACEHADSGSAAAPPPPPYSLAQGVANTQGTDRDETVVDRLADGRCNREQKCDNVGGGRKFASREVCMEEMRGHMANDLNEYNCPRGLDTAAVERCAAAIQAEECGHPLDTLSRMEKCRTSALCLD